MDPGAGAFAHYIESGARVVAGMLGAFVLALAVKANVVLGMTESMENPRAMLVQLAIAAGSSERLVPGLLNRVEAMLQKPGD